MSEEKQRLLSDEELEGVVGGATLLSPMPMQQLNSIFGTCDGNLGNSAATGAANANACAATTRVSGSRPIPFI